MPHDRAKKCPAGGKLGRAATLPAVKPGTGEVAKIRAAIAERVPDLLAAMMARALEGDVGAARLLLERAVAPLKAQESPALISLPDGTLTDQGRAVLAAVAAGELAPGQGAQLLVAIGTLGKIAEVDELTRRIEILEGNNEHP